MMHISYALSKGIAKPAYTVVINQPSSFVYVSDDGIQLISCSDNQITNHKVSVLSNEVVLSLGAVFLSSVFIYYGAMTSHQTYMLHTATIKGDVSKGIELEYMPSSILHV